MKSDWVVCVDNKNTKHLVKDKRYLVQWHGTKATVLGSVNSPYDLARGSVYKRERFKLISTMKYPNITNYLLIDEYGEIGTFKKVEELESHLSDIYNDGFDNTQIIFVYDNGKVTQRYVNDVVSYSPKLNPEFK